MEPICHQDDLADGEGRRFRAAGGELLLLRHDGCFHAYRNDCPHMNLPLTNRSRVAVDAQRGQLMCMQHAAAFDIKNGLCVQGPCVGMELVPVALKVLDGQLWLDEIK